MFACVLLVLIQAAELSETSLGTFIFYWFPYEIPTAARLLSTLVPI